jgi:hypothetical protein
MQSWGVDQNDVIVITSLQNTMLTFGSQQQMVLWGQE